MKMSYAYDELYLQDAMRNLGNMYDYAVNKLKYKLEEYQKMFLVSRVSQQFAIGNPAYVTGVSGCELAKKVVEECTGVRPQMSDIMEQEPSTEYRIGEALAYYQWMANVDFKTINNACSLTELKGRDKDGAVKLLQEKMAAYEEQPALRRLRDYAGLTQKALSEKAGVPLRQVQLFEQGQRDIRKCQGQTLLQLANALHCTVEELI